MIKRQLIQWFHLANSYVKRSQWRGNNKIICLSLQKTGTTSFGDFFTQLGYPVVRSDLAQLRRWNEYWYLGQFHRIFADPVFRNYQVFEDAPFWCLDFYKTLQQKYPKAQYVLFTRNSEAWFNSLLAHGKGEILGNKYFHAENYAIPEAQSNPQFRLENHKAYYIQFYEERNNAIISYFKDILTPFIHLTLEDQDKWQKLGAFVGLEIDDNFEIHSNKLNT